MQFDFGNIDPFIVDGVQLANILNNWRDAVYSLQRGPTRPVYVVPGQLWIDDSGGTSNWVLKQHISPTLGDAPIWSINTVNGQITLASSLRVTNPPPGDMSQSIPSTTWVNEQINAAINAALATIMPVGTIFDVPGILVAAPTGFILSGAGTIGSVASGASIRARDDTQPLFNHVWTLNNLEAPVYSNTGVAVARGASAFEDWSNNRRIGGLDFRGVARATFDAGAGRLSAFPRVGVIGGAQTHTLSGSELAAHAHGLTIGGVGVSDPGHSHDANGNAFYATGGDFGGQYAGTGSNLFIRSQTNNVSSGVSAGLNGSWGVGNAGGNAAHNNIQPTRTVTTLIKL
jgi:microcystin-dependent protein